MHALPLSRDPNLLIGFDQFSDAGVYQISKDAVIVQTVDFFPPIVDDPFVYGQIAAANALSDVYAMGGRPRTALNIVGFPDDELPLDILEQILRGGADRVEASGAVMVGGHSLRDREVKFGLSVTGLVDPNDMLSNRSAKPGDVLVLTKMLGTGFVTTALRAGRCRDDVLEAACRSMVQLNRFAAESAVSVGAKAATDISGFGLAGHASLLARASGVTLHLEMGRLPVLPGSEELSRSGFRSRANATNRRFVADRMRIALREDSGRLEYLFDPQTSGGLLVSLDPDRAGALMERCRDAGETEAVRVGSVDERGDADLVIAH